VARIDSLVDFKMALVQKGKATCLESSCSNLIARQEAFVAAGSIKKCLANTPRNWLLPQGLLYS